MRISAEELIDFAVPDAVQTMRAKDMILYALSTGYGAEPCDAAHLRHIYEEKLVAVPTVANVTAHHGSWMKTAGVDWDSVVHAEQRLTVHHPIPVDVPLVSKVRCLSVVDRGAGKGMFATFKRTIRRHDDGTPLATIVQTNACRGDGGCGTAGIPPDPLPPPPERPADVVLRIDLPVDAAALYRLNGDLNPLHIDPASAARAGFDRPILHGLCTFGYAGYALGKALAVAGLRDIASIAARFSAPVFPGEPIDVHIWQDGDEARFRVIVPSRGTIVLDRGTATLT
jgi:acyl dehydratase